ncbi:MAG: hypothetical protein NTV49_10545 [Kiritimatiellaeota bacterium]|nr:hypothetical protein [Kiritimatiellota bacterium]
MKSTLSIMRECKIGLLPSFNHVAWAVLGWLALVSSARSAQPFDYFANSYSVVGLKDYDTGVRILPDNSFAGLQVKIGPALKPLAAEHKKTLLNGWMPIVVIKAEDSGVAYDTLIWVSPLPTAKDWRKAFDWPTEGEKYLLWAVVEATNKGGAPAAARASIGSKEFTWTLAPGQSARGVLRKPTGDSGDFDSADPDVWLGRTVQYWQSVRNRCARIEVPERKATDAFWASLCYQLIANDQGKYRPGEGFWDNFWIRDGAGIAMQYEEVGLWDVVRKGFDEFFRWQRDDGRFDCAFDGIQSPEFDGNGQALWAFWQYYKISSDTAWMTEHYPQMRRAADWIVQALKRSDTEAPGLLPGCQADGENLMGTHRYHIVGYDFWNLRGLICAADVARSLGRIAEAEEMMKEVAAYREAIDQAQKRTGLAYFPPSWEKAGTHWGNTESLWPVPIFDLKDPRVTATIKHLREEFGGGFIEGTMQWGGKRDIIHSYLGSFTTLCTMRQGDHEQTVEDFYWYLLHSTPANAFAEVISFKERRANSDTIPHTWGGCNYALELRHMLADERGDELHLLSAVPDWWLEDGREIRVERAPTHFGELFFIARGTPAGVEVQLIKPLRTPPKRIVLYLPKSRPLTKRIGGVDVVTREPQKTRWSFAHVVALYTKSNDLNQPVYEQFLRNEPATRLEAKAEP